MNSKWKHLFLKSPFLPLYQRGNIRYFYVPLCPESFRGMLIPAKAGIQKEVKINTKFLLEFIPHFDAGQE